MRWQQSSIIALMFGLMWFDLSATADDWHPQDTGTPRDVVAVKAWPAKVLIDTQAGLILLVWLDSSTPRTQRVSFQQIASIASVPSYEGQPAELHLNIADGEGHLLAIGGSTKEKGDLLTALTGLAVNPLPASTARLFSRQQVGIALPHIILGSSDAEDALSLPTIPPPADPTTQVDSTTITVFDQPSGFIGQSDGRGQLENSTIKKIIQSNMGAYQNCYERALRGNSTLSGEIAVQFVIEEDGSVTRTRVASSSMNNTTVHECLCRTVESLNFQAPNGGTVVVTFPFDFNSTGSEQ